MPVLPSCPAFFRFILAPGICAALAVPVQALLEVRDVDGGIHHPQAVGTEGGDYHVTVCGSCSDGSANCSLDGPTITFQLEVASTDPIPTATREEAPDRDSTFTNATNLDAIEIGSPGPGENRTYEVEVTWDESETVACGDCVDLKVFRVTFEGSTGETETVTVSAELCCKKVNPIFLTNVSSTDSVGSPRSGTAPVSFSLWTLPLGGTFLNGDRIYSEFLENVEFTEGRATLSIGRNNPIPEGLTERNQPLWAEIVIDGELFEPRIPVASSLTSIESFRSRSTEQVVKPDGNPILTSDGDDIVFRPPLVVRKPSVPGFLPAVIEANETNDWSIGPDIGRTDGDPPFPVPDFTLHGSNASPVKGGEGGRLNLAAGNAATGTMATDAQGGSIAINGGDGVGLGLQGDLLLGGGIVEIRPTTDLPTGLKDEAPSIAIGGDGGGPVVYASEGQRLLLRSGTGTNFGAVEIRGDPLTLGTDVDADSLRISSDGMGIKLDGSAGSNLTLRGGEGFNGSETGGTLKLSGGPSFSGGGDHDGGAVTVEGGAGSGLGERGELILRGRLLVLTPTSDTVTNATNLSESVRLTSDNGTLTLGTTAGTGYHIVAGNPSSSVRVDDLGVTLFSGPNRVRLELPNDRLLDLTDDAGTLRLDTSAGSGLSLRAGDGTLAVENGQPLTLSAGGALPTASDAAGGDTTVEGGSGIGTGDRGDLVLRGGRVTLTPTTDTVTGATDLSDSLRLTSNDGTLTLGTTTGTGYHIIAGNPSSSVRVDDLGVTMLSGSGLVRLELPNDRRVSLTDDAGTLRFDSSGGNGLSIRAGDGIALSESGTGLTLSAGDALSSALDADGGDLTLRAGDGAGIGQSGRVIVSGTATFTGSQTSIKLDTDSSDASIESDAGAALRLVGGKGVGGGGTGHELKLEGGSATTGSGAQDGGDVSLTPGTGAAGGEDGRILLAGVVEQTGQSHSHEAGVPSVALRTYTHLDSDPASTVLELGVTSAGPTGQTFISFEENGSPIGSIANTGGGICISGTTCDFAEYLPKRNADENIPAGSVVGLHGGRASLVTEDAEQLMVVSRNAILRGNDPGGSREGFVLAAFIGQVDVMVSGDAREGDFILASEKNDGRAIAVRAEELKLQNLENLIGRAWSRSRDGTVRVSVGLGIDRREAIGLLAEQNKRLESRLAKLEQRIETMVKESRK